MDVIEPDSYMEYAMSSHLGDPDQYESSNESMKSCGKEKVRNGRISELEDKLAKAEDRCSVLRNQVAYMKMLYTSSHQIKSCSSEDNADDFRMKNNDSIPDDTLQPFNTKGSPGAAPADILNRSNVPATTQSLMGSTIAKDPKEAMQLIVNEMTQSVNAMEGSVNIHSNTIERMILSSRHRKRRSQKREDSSNVKAGRVPSANFRDQTRSTVFRTTLDKRPSRPLTGKSRTSAGSVKNKKKAGRNTAGAKQRAKRNSVEPLKVKRSAKEEKLEHAIKYQGSQPAKAYSTEMRPSISHVASSTYLLPTLSYRMKCVPKSYRREFSFHRIPFVLGKSTNKSHNIGAKIQETLSLIKLSRRGLQSAGNVNKKEELSNLLYLKMTGEQNTSAAEPSSMQLPSSAQSKHRSPMTVGTSSEYKNYQLRTVLMNLHDEFYKMTENYETMKASLNENKDPEVEQKVQVLEEELNAKEIEINAFMNLYNEVTQLKDQLNTKGSYSAPGAYKPTSVSVCESSSTLKMTRLLRRIEQFQSQLKSMAYV